MGRMAARVSIIALHVNLRAELAIRLEISDRVSENPRIVLGSPSSDEIVYVE